MPVWLLLGDAGSGRPPPEEKGTKTGFLVVAGSAPSNPGMATSSKQSPQQWPTEGLAQSRVLMPQRLRKQEIKPNSGQCQNDGCKLSSTRPFLRSSNFRLVK
jgi:hypothetical protein